MWKFVDTNVMGNRNDKDMSIAMCDSINELGAGVESPRGMPGI